MIPELGHFALILALALAVIQTTLPLIGSIRQHSNWIAVARPAAVGQAVFVSLAYISLTYAFVYNDFSVLYVAKHSNSHLPLIYRIVSVWGGHEGSLLLWNLLLVFWTVAVVLFSRNLPPILIARVIAVMGFISSGFLLFILTTSNPFARLIPVPVDGNDLNPLLQDPGLIVHPPMLYMGYVGFSVAYSFAIAALLGGTLDSAWARWSRPWTLIAWAFLTIGITLGSWWAYYELGWGGWWFWDPVENASFMPWLIGTALIHSLAVTEKRSTFKNWTVLLAILAFSLSLLGTFLVRSGVLTSVHAFATDPKRGVFILAFLGTVIATSLLLYAWRAPKIGSGGHFTLLSRESLLLSNNIILVVAGTSVLLGTLYPLFLDALDLGKISVGPPYFSVTFTLIIAPLFILLGIGIHTHWQRDHVQSLVARLFIPFMLSVLCGIALIAVIDWHHSTVILGITVAGWIILTSAHNAYDRLRQSLVTTKEAPGSKRMLRSLPRHFYGMTLAHIGVAVFISGVVISNAFSVEKDTLVEPGTTVTVAGYEFIFEGVITTEGANYTAKQGVFRVLKDGKELTVLHPQKRLYRVQTMPMTEAAIDAGFTRDIYVALGEPLEGEAWSARIYYKPFIRWLWLGGLLMALGGILAATDRRYRLARRRQHPEKAGYSRESGKPCGVSS